MVKKTKFNTCGARTRKGTPCQCKPVRWGGRCRLHGGLSSGPKTPQGKAQSRANLQRALAAINAGTPEAAAARQRRAANGLKTRREREWCRRHNFDPTTYRRIPKQS